MFDALQNPTIALKAPQANQLELLEYLLSSHAALISQKNKNCQQIQKMAASMKVKITKHFTVILVEQHPQNRLG